MSSTEQHPSASVLAEYVEGSLTQDVSATTETHVERCPTCQEVIEQLTAVRDALRDLPAERPVPELVSARVFAALAAESSPAPSGDVVPAFDTDADADTGTVAWFRRRAPRALAAAASVAVIGLAGYIAVTTGDGGGMTTAESSNRAGGSSEAEAGAEKQMGAQDESSVVEEELSGAGDGGADSGAPAPDVASLRTAVTDVWEDGSELAPGCGETLADELGLSLVGSAESGAGVLVVLEDEPAAQLQGHVVSTCGSTTAEELSEPVTLTRP